MAVQLNLPVQMMTLGLQDCRIWDCSRAIRSAALTLFVVGVGLPAHAHESSSHNLSGGFVDGFIHPLLGADHVSAMVAVGIWGAILGRPLIWILPLAFPMAMALGGAYGVFGFYLPWIEPGIAISSIVIGLAILSGWRASISVASAVVAVFAVFHGYAHGIELPHAANASTFAMGFVTSTGLLHIAGIAFGLLKSHPWGGTALRVAGAAIAVAGGAFLFQLV